jgi:hypothetical protein
MSLVRRVVSVNRWVPRRRGAINKKTTRVSQVKWTMAPTAAAKPDLVRSVTTDAASLQAYLSRNTHKRVFLLSSEDFYSVVREWNYPSDFSSDFPLLCGLEHPISRFCDAV